MGVTKQQRHELTENGEIMKQPDTYLAILAALSFSDQEELTPTEISNLTDFTQGGYHSISSRVPRNDPALLDARTNPTRFVLTEDGQRLVERVQDEHDLHHSYISELSENNQQDRDETAEESTTDEPDEDPEFTCSICGFGRDREKDVRRHVTLKEDDAHQGVSGDVVDVVERREPAEDDEPDEPDDSEDEPQGQRSIDRLDAALGNGSDPDRDPDPDPSSTADRDEQPRQSSTAYQSVMERPALEWDDGDLDIEALAELDREQDPLIGAIIAVTLDVAEHARKDKTSSHQRAEVRAKELESMAEAVEAITAARRERRLADQD